MGVIPDETDISEMPISKENLRALFEHLDRTAMTGYACDHSFSLTKSFLQERHLLENTIMPWLSEHGAGCDCEIIFNVAENWAEVVDYVDYNAPDEDDDDRPPDQDKKPWWKFW